MILKIFIMPLGGELVSVTTKKQWRIETLFSPGPDRRGGEAQYLIWHTSLDLAFGFRSCFRHWLWGESKQNSTSPLQWIEIIVYVFHFCGSMGYVAPHNVLRLHQLWFKCCGCLKTPGLAIYIDYWWNYFQLPMMNATPQMRDGK